MFIELRPDELALLLSYFHGVVMPYCTVNEVLLCGLVTEGLEVSGCCRCRASATKNQQNVCENYSIDAHASQTFISESLRSDR